MFKRAYTRREHFTAWLLCSNAAWLTGLSLALSPNGASLAEIAAAAGVSVIVSAALFYALLYRMKRLVYAMLVLAVCHVISLIIATFFLGLVYRWGRCSTCGFLTVIYGGFYGILSLYWPWFILCTLVTISLIAYRGWGKALKLK